MRRFSVLAAVLALVLGSVSRGQQAEGYRSIDGYDRPTGTWLDWPLVRLRDPDRAGVSYGQHPRQAMDLWLAEPAEGQAGPRPVVVHFHHGGFGWGDKSMVPGYMVQRFNEMGVTVVSANYRFLYHAGWPAPLEDGARVVQWLRYHAEDLNIDPDRVAALGTSAGAIMSMWLALHDDFADPDAEDPVARESTRLSIAASFEGQPTLDLDVYDEIHGKPLFRDVGFMARAIGLPEIADDKAARAELLEYYSAESHVDPDDPPVLLFYALAQLPYAELTGMFWTIHHPDLSDKLVRRLNAAGVPWLRQVYGEAREALDGFDDRGEVFEIFARQLGVASD